MFVLMNKNICFEHCGKVNTIKILNNGNIYAKKTFSGFPSIGLFSFIKGPLLSFSKTIRLNAGKPKLTFTW
jgi:hypothetical protein